MSRFIVNSKLRSSSVSKTRWLIDYWSTVSREFLLNLPFTESLKRCNSFAEEVDDGTPSPKRTAVSPDLDVKREPREHGGERPAMTSPVSSPQARKTPDQESVNSNGKYLRESLYDRPHEYQYPWLSKELSALSLRHPPMELLSKLFPHQNMTTLEHILQSCHGSVVESIEMLLSTQESRGSKVRALGGFGFSAVSHASPFLHGPMTRNVITRPLTSTHACSPTRLYPASPLPPPLLVKPKPEMAFKFSSIAHAPYNTESRACGLAMTRFCSRCGHKIAVFDKFCAHCGKVLSESANGLWFRQQWVYATGRREGEDGKTLVCDKRDRAITCVFFRDHHLIPMFSGPLQKDLFKGKWRCFKQNYCHACHTRFAVFFPLPSCCVSSLM